MKVKKQLWMLYWLPLFMALFTVMMVGRFTSVRAQDQENNTQGKIKTETPIRHLIIIIGENHSFDNLFGAYQPDKDQSVSNLLSKGIIKEDGSPGPDFSKAAQQKATDTGVYQINPSRTDPWKALPQPNTTHAAGQKSNVPDHRFPADLPNGPFQITNYVPYDAYVGDPVHRFFQMWQEVDEGRMDLFPWVAATAGIGPRNGPAHGGESMGFYNMHTGDAPFFLKLAHEYAISDNYHQPIMGGTGANFIAIITGDVGFYNRNGNPAGPPKNQIENPDPLPGTNNQYSRDGYRGGSYVNCSDLKQAGVSAIRNFLHSLSYKPFRDGNCAPDTYYLVNNYRPGYTPAGEPQRLGPGQFTLPPQTFPTIADALSAKGVSWKWYSGGRNRDGTTTDEYCDICDPLTHFRSIMTSSLKNSLQGMADFDQDISSEKTLPPVSFVRPFESLAGHPANATLSGYEKFVADLVKKVKAHPEVWSKTAILITFDEGGGYYDSGYIQPIDFFGDGPRVPLIAVSPFAKKGFVDHIYYDHVSILKFIEKNWDLKPLSNRSRDNLPNPVMSRDNPYAPVNSPAIGDLMNLFDLGR
ncbi:MAG: alkaline phosphatase family protein [Nitrospiria bacterium]